MEPTNYYTPEIKKMKTIMNHKCTARNAFEWRKKQDTCPGKLLIFKTNIETTQQVKAIQSIFKNLPAITDWSVDTEDIDHVLRIETFENLQENEVISLMTKYDFYCEILTD